MKNIKIAFLVLLASGCYQKEPCNVDTVLFGYPSEPQCTIYELNDIWVHSDSIADVLCEGELSSQFLKIDSFYIRFTQKDLLNRCSPVACNMPFRKRERIQVIINKENTILFEGEKVRIDKLDSLVMVYYLNDGKEKDRPSRLLRAELTVNWDKRASQNTVEHVIREMALGYSSALQSLYSDSYKITICDSILQNDKELLRDYPLFLSLRFGRELMLNGRLPIPVPPPIL